MILLELSRHFQIIAGQLKAIGSNESYRIDRIWQNLRLDLPALQNAVDGTFLDSGVYPPGYPDKRGPNVHPTRQLVFESAFTDEISVLEAAASRVKNASRVAEIEVACMDYLRTLESVWNENHFLTIGEICNSNNAASDVPDILCRYINLRHFIRHILISNIPRTRHWGPERVKQFVEGLETEHRKPDYYWHSLGQLWGEARQLIRSGTLAFNVRPQFPTGEAKFFADGVRAIHRQRSFTSYATEALHYVVRELALPGWETEADRKSKLGIVAVYMTYDGCRAFRPTILDHLGALSYFFLPARHDARCGSTWRLSDCLCYNSPRDFGGHSEWTVIIPPDGIPAVIQKGGSGPEPAFELAGLTFGDDHASLLPE